MLNELVLDGDFCGREMDEEGCCGNLKLANVRIEKVLFSTRLTFNNHVLHLYNQNLDINNELTYSMEQSLCLNVNTSSPIPEITRVLGSPEIHDRIRLSLP